MLILTRRANESVTIGNDVRVTVLGVKGNQVRVGIVELNSPGSLIIAWGFYYPSFVIAKEIAIMCSPM